MAVKTVTETTLLTTYLIIGGLGFLFLLISLVVGDIFEAAGLDFGLDLDGNGDFGLLDSRVIGIFLTAFGGFGAIAVIFNFGVFVSIIFALFGGFVFGASVYRFGKFLYRQQSSSSVSEEDLLGRSAQVIVGIQPNQIGQISCRIGEERVEKIARSKDGSEIKAGETVRIESITGEAVIVSVDKGEGFALFSEKA